MHRFYEFMLNDKFNFIALEFRGTVGNKLALCECMCMYTLDIWETLQKDKISGPQIVRCLVKL